MDLSNTYIDRVEAAGPGFINFFLTNAWLYDVLKVIQKEKENYGNLDIGRGQKVMVEFVSANPTGPLHMAMPEAERWEIVLPVFLRKPDMM